MENAINNKAPLTHSHNLYDISISSGSTSEFTYTNFDIYSQAIIDASTANRSIFMSANSIFIEYTKDNGNTWIEYEVDAIQKQNLLAGNHASNVTLGGPGASNPKIGWGLRITLSPCDDGRYSNLDFVYCWFSDYGHTVTWGLEYMKYGDQTQYLHLAGPARCQGYPSGNVIYAPGITTFGGTNNAQRGYKIRATWIITENSGEAHNYMIFGLMAVIATARHANEMMRSGHLYSWDYNKNAIFPANVYVKNNTGYTDSKIRNISLSINIPTKLDNGEICLVYQ